MLRSLFCGACFSYIIPPPRSSLSSGFWHLLPPDAKNRSSKEETARAVNPGKRGRCTLFPAAAPSVLCYFYSSSACPVFIFRLLLFLSRLLLFLSCRPHQPGKQKTTLTPRIKPTMPAANAIAPPPFFYHILPYIIRRMQLQPVAKGKITAQRASFFAPERCKTLPHLLYF